MRKITKRRIAQNGDEEVYFSGEKSAAKNVKRRPSSPAAARKNLEMGLLKTSKTKGRFPELYYNRIVQRRNETPAQRAERLEKTRSLGEAYQRREAEERQNRETLQRFGVKTDQQRRGGKTKKAQMGTKTKAQKGIKAKAKYGTKAKAKYGATAKKVSSKRYK